MNRQIDIPKININTDGCIAFLQPIVSIKMVVFTRVSGCTYGKKLEKYSNVELLPA